MNVLWVVDNYLDVSIQRNQWTETIKILLRKKHQLFLITGYKNSSKSDYGLKHHIHNIRVSPFNKIGQIVFHIKILINVTRFIFKKKPDVILFHPSVCLTLFPFVVLKKARMIKPQFVLDVRTLPLGLSSKLVKTIFGFAMYCSKYLYDGTTVITPFMKEILCKQYRLNPNRIGTWTSGVKLSHFSPKRTNELFKNKLKETFNIKKKFVVMYHGVLSPDRGLQDCIKAMIQISKRHFDIVLVLIGNGPAKGMLENMVESLDLAECVRIAGPVPHETIPEYVNLADVGILPFPRDLWWRVSSPIKLMEYLAMQKSVIVTEIEAHRDVLNGHPFGIFIRNNQPAEIAKGIERAYQARKRLPRIGLLGRIMVQNHHTLKAQATRLETYLNSIVKK